MHIFTNPNFDFVKWKWHAIALSWVIILFGVFVIWTKGMPKGVEFSGGTIVIVKFDQTPDLDKIREALPGGGANAAGCCSASGQTSGGRPGRPKIAAPTPSPAPRTGSGGRCVLGSPIGRSRRSRRRPRGHSCRA